MALGRKVNQIVYIVLGKETVYKFAITNITLYEETSLVINVVFNGT